MTLFLVTKGQRKKRVVIPGGRVGRSNGSRRGGDETEDSVLIAISFCAKQNSYLQLLAEFVFRMCELENCDVRGA